VMVRRFTS